MRIRPALTTASLILIAASAAACSSGSNAATPTSPASAPSSPSAAVAGASTAKATCAQLTAAQVQPLLVQPVTKVTHKAVPDQVSLNGTAQQCTFATSESQQAITVTVVGGADADNDFIGQQRSLSKPVSVPGIGQKSVRDGDDNTSTITAEASGLSCSVATSAEDQIPGVAALEQAAGDTSDIGDAKFAAISAALGTLCNRIFGSGYTTPNLSGLK